MFAGLFEPIHLLLVLGIALILFGPGKLGNLGHDLGKAVRDFRSAMDGREATPEAVSEKPAPAQAEKIDAACPGNISHAE